MKEYEQNELNKVKRGPKRATYNVTKINEILDAGFIGYVNFIYQNQAICLPMAYGRNGNKIYLHSSLKNRMLLSILDSKSVSMTVTHLDALILARSGFHHSVNYRSATLFGNAKKIEDSIEKEMALKCLVDHMIPKRWEEIRPMNEKEFNGTLVIEMTIESASAKIRNVGVQDEKSDESLPIWAGIVPIKQIAEYPISDKGLPKKMDIPEHVIDYYNKNR
ncbi:pyridoxamine 5'-phosphate oxidase family protein [Urechidicola croceus]|nr:pyridoxamine 5'-phosphate oxidase family protein [Urechidicola croceus]